MPQSEMVSATRLEKLSYSREFGSPIMGWFRIFSFFVLVLCLFPIQALRLGLKFNDIYKIPQLFHRLLIKTMGFKIVMHGVPTNAPSTLYVANHTSYLDIPVLAALIPASFVAKAEVANWPLFGFLSTLQKTIFIERQATKAAVQRDHLQEWLLKGQSMILFPEGTSSDGQMVLPFKSSLFSIVEQASKTTAITVQPISLVCTKLGGLPMTTSLRPYYSWFGDMTLASHLWDVFCMGDFTVDVFFHPPVTSETMNNRKVLAAYCQEQVSRGIEWGISGRHPDDLTIVPPSSH